MDSNFVGQLISDVILIFIVLAFAAFLIWLGSRTYNISARMRLQRAEAFNRLLERFNSAKEFTEFLQTEEGKLFLRDPIPTSRASSNRILRFTQAGIVIFAIGIGFLINAYRLHDAIDINYIRQGQDAQFWGTFGVIVGIALIITAVVSHAMARKWHLLNGNGHGNDVAR